MMENKIFKLMKKADPPLFQRLLSFEQTQAADEFEELWSSMNISIDSIKIESIENHQSSNESKKQPFYATLKIASS